MNTRLRCSFSATVEKKQNYQKYVPFRLLTSQSHIAFLSMAVAILQRDSPGQFNELVTGSLCWYFVFHPVSAPVHLR